MSTDKGSTIHIDAGREPRLTPAASEKLEQNMENFRAQILREIVRRSSDPDRSVRASDVDIAVSRIGVSGTASYTSRLLILSLILSCCAILAQIIILAISNKSTHVNGTPLLVGVGTGTTAMAATLLVTQELRRRRRLMSVPRSEFLHAFMRLEDRMRINAQELLGPLAESTSLGRIISAIELLQLWTPEDSYAFRRLLGIRNSIVHEDNRGISAEKMAEALSGLARLYNLLEEDASSGARRRVKEVVANRAALSYEERVANSLRRAHLEVSAARKDASYDLLAGRSDSLKRVIVKYRSSGLLTVKDVSSVADQSSSSIGTVIVTNAKVSPYVFEYLDLTQENSKNQDGIKVVSWRDGDDTSTLVQAIIPENA